MTLGLGTWGFFTIREQQRWNSYVEQLNSQPGIVVTKAENRNGKYFIAGMRDPLAIEPNRLLQKFHIKEQAIKANWQPYLSLEPELTIERAEKLLQPPKTVSLKTDQNGILYATGSAPRQWILETRKLWRFVPGITQFKEEIENFDISQLNLYQKQLEQKELLFKEGTAELLPSETAKLQDLVLEVQQFIDVGESLRKDVKIQIIGHTNKTGDEQINLQLSQRRANIILSYLISQVNRKYFTTVGVGSTNTMNSKLEKQDVATNRKVSFKVFITDTRN